MRVLAFVLAALLAQGCLVGDEASQEKRPAPSAQPWPWDRENKQVRDDAHTIFDLCGGIIGEWQKYDKVYYSIPRVNWDGGSVTKHIEAHHYIDKTREDEGKPACELQVWIDARAVKYMKDHRITCSKPQKYDPATGKPLKFDPDTGKRHVFFDLKGFKGSPDDAVAFERYPNGDCHAKLLFIVGNDNGSLTIAVGHKSSDNIAHPFQQDKTISGYEGGILSADKHGVLGEVKNTSIGMLPVPRDR